VSGRLDAIQEGVDTASELLTWPVIPVRDATNVWTRPAISEADVRWLLAIARAAERVRDLRFASGSMRDGEFEAAWDAFESALAADVGEDAWILLPPGDGMSRCTPRKHVREKGRMLCDCGALTVIPTAAKNALVVTLLDPLQREGLATWAAAHPEKKP
jgi:hypothetical protein